MKRFTLALGVALVFCIPFGCSGPKPTPDPRQGVVAITILDDLTDRWFSSSKLYLKIESSLEPGVAQLIPVNVGKYRGQNRVVHETLFHFKPGKNETLLLEWLDDQSFTPDQEAAIVAAINDGGSVVVEGARLWLLEKFLIWPSVSGLKQAVNEYGKMVAGVDARQFKSFGKADYNVPAEPPESHQAANPTIVLERSIRAKAEAVFYYPKN